MEPTETLKQEWYDVITVPLIPVVGIPGDNNYRHTLGCEFRIHYLLQQYNPPLSGQFHGVPRPDVVLRQSGNNPNLQILQFHALVRVGESAICPVRLPLLNGEAYGLLTGL